MSELPAGRELDALVAERVMGLTVSRALLERLFVEAWFIEARNESHRSYDVMMTNYCAVPVPPYSTDVAAAWEVVEKLAASWDVELYRYHELTPPTGWVCKIGELVDGDPIWGATGATAPLAVCRAALKVGSET